MSEPNSDDTPFIIPEDTNWKAFASVAIAAFYAILLDGKRDFTISVERIEEIREAMAHRMVALGVRGPDNDENMTFNALLDMNDGLPN
jgi:hypothetical protein